MSYKILEKVAVVLELAVLIFNCKPVASIRATFSAVMNSTKMGSVLPQDRGPVPPSSPNPHTHLPAPPGS